MASTKVAVLEQCRVGPQPTDEPELLEKPLPLTFFDVPWLSLPPVKHLLFYEFPQSKRYTSLTPSTAHKYVLSSCAATAAVSNVDDTVVVPLLAVQFTLFPDAGMCVGFTMHHITGDASALINFIASFASLTKFGGEANKLLPPFLDRKVIGDRNGLEEILWKQIGDIKYVETPYIHKVRATFVITKSDVEKLKKAVLGLRPTLSYASTFTVACAYVWICFAKLRAKCAKELDERAENFFWTAECRSRLDPPVPANYFGNCLIPFFATAKTSKLVMGDGLATAAEMIGEAIRKKLHEGEDVLKGFENWMVDFGRIKANEEPVVSVVGSPKFSFYDSEGGYMEIGLSFPELEMDAFATIFSDGLESL
ncbi:hypothetical protein RJ639_004163 [Escallonia herrerae]|uniref:Uncharacterized protein n=1 Tax=Escallonia herrerae TaxID=1293975 RepID=A0AA88W589_9ASTE|nr:hypothetical protein RJ639_004163 [Escallonia herrerae]